MYAIVLTFDEQIGFAELVYKKYMQMWPKCPLTFRIPYQDKQRARAFKECSNVDLVESPRSIRDTMSTLLEGLSNDEWVFWCIDDRYPLTLDATAMDRIYNSIVDNDPPLERIKLFTWREQLKPGSHFELGGRVFLRQLPMTPWGFWHHSFMRVTALRKIFINNDLSEEYTIKRINKGLLKDDKLRLICSNNIAVPHENIITMGEPCIKGCLTSDGLRELQSNDCTIPKYNISDHNKRFVHKDVAAKHRGSYESRAIRKPPVSGHKPKEIGASSKPQVIIKQQNSS